MREIITILICPYCGDEKTGSRAQRGCCGESYNHFEEIEVWADTKDELTDKEKLAIRDDDTKDEEIGSYPIGYSEAVMRESGY